MLTGVSLTMCAKCQYNRVRRAIWFAQPLGTDRAVGQSCARPYTHRALLLTISRGSDLATVLLARQLFTPLEAIENAALLIEDGRIAAAGSRDAVRIPSQARVVDFGDAVLAPGLIDIHIHGGAGHDVMEGSDESLAAIERLMTTHGVEPDPNPTDIVEKNGRGERI